MLDLGWNLTPVVIYDLDVVCPREQVHPEQDGLRAQFHDLLLLVSVRPCGVEESFSNFEIVLNRLRNREACRTVLLEVRGDQRMFWQRFAAA